MFFRLVWVYRSISRMHAILTFDIYNQILLFFCCYCSFLGDSVMLSIVVMITPILVSSPSTWICCTFMFLFRRNSVKFY